MVSRTYPPVQVRGPALPVATPHTACPIPCVVVSAAVVAGALGVGACGPEPAVTTVTDSTTAPTLNTTAEDPEADQAPETDRDTGDRKSVV